MTKKKLPVIKEDFDLERDYVKFEDGKFVGSVRICLAGGDYMEYESYKKKSGGSGIDKYACGYLTIIHRMSPKGLTTTYFKHTQKPILTEEKLMDIANGLLKLKGVTGLFMLAPAIAIYIIFTQ